MVRLLKDRALRIRMGEAGLTHVTEQFGVGRMLQGTLDAYHRAADVKIPEGGAVA
jgi:hypothetical protein